MCRSDCSIEKIGFEKALFRLRKNTRFGLRSEIALFNPPIRLRKNWPTYVNLYKFDSQICNSVGSYSPEMVVIVQICVFPQTRCSWRSGERVNGTARKFTRKCAHSVALLMHSSVSVIPCSGFREYAGLFFGQFGTMRDEGRTDFHTSAVYGCL